MAEELYPAFENVSSSISNINYLELIVVRGTFQVFVWDWFQSADEVEVWDRAREFDGWRYAHISIDRGWFQLNDEVSLEEAILN